MLLSIKHTTDLFYNDYINESVMELRMAPRQEQNQRRLSFSIDIGPATSVKSYFDWLGNTIHAFSINAMHDRIQIIATSIVETEARQNRLELFPDVWLPDANFDYTLCDFLLFDGAIVDTPLLRELAAGVLSQVSSRNAPVKLGNLVLAMLKMIDEKFEYQKGVTGASSPITEILEHRKGVCQDFTHLMIGLARALNIPARYVSGYIHPDRQRLRGYTQTHAWVELFFPSIGWVGVDPTNNCVVGENFVKVAIGRNFQDVPPNKGVYKGKSEERIDVAVTSEELKSVPAELAAERAGVLNVPIYEGTNQGGKEQHREQQQQEQQEQQQQQ
ncbi:MAG: transglutaminase family protein [Cyanobacteria bacterium REEB67]|jgi:transglutaminase-like putative cysteine protease|nr:transglutaminase family protein [Cyanobacteria bacterium REEB67]